MLFTATNWLYLKSRLLFKERLLSRESYLFFLIVLIRINVHCAELKMRFMQSFYLGIHQLWDALLIMQQPGVYWLNVDKQDYARLLCQQTLRRQSADSRSALIAVNSEPATILTHKPVRFSSYTLPLQRQAVLHLQDDVMRSMKAKNLFLLLYTPNELWQSLTIPELTRWLTQISQWAAQQQLTLLILNHSVNTPILRNYLVSQHRSLSGLASLTQPTNELRYDVDFWCNHLGVTAKQKLKVVVNDQMLIADEEPNPATHYTSDEDYFLAVRTLFQNVIPPENWQLFSNNEELTSAGMRVSASTLIFTLEKREQINTLIHQIYSLRQQRGNGLKIVVQALTPNMRANDEHALLASGANVILDHTVLPEKLLIQVKAIQGEIFSRYIPDDLGDLLSAVNPLPLRGYIDSEVFSHSVIELINNAFIPEDNKGVLLIYTPAKGLKAEQALTLCRIRRDGDLITIFNDKLVLFLSNCKINELNSTLRFIFKLPVDHAFAERQEWFKDQDILAKMYQLREQQAASPVQHPSDEEIAAITDTKNAPIATNVTRPVRVPQEMTLHIQAD